MLQSRFAEVQIEPTTTTTVTAQEIGVVVIGRNEGDRLRRCLESLRQNAAEIVYVDSGSTDGSVGLAQELDVDVVDLDASVPFTAARARNAGFERLMALHPQIPLVMFVDGDCEVFPGWLPAARRTFAADPRIAVAAGRLRERFPSASIYNRLCDLEWHVLAGEASSCGGIAVMRCDAFREAGKFDPQVIAGEEPDLCVRLRRCGWKIVRLADDMALHDAAMTRFSQWWKRAVRAGHAYAEGAARYGRSPERHFVRESVSGWLYGFVVPAVIVAGVALWGAWGLLPALVYPLLFAKIAIGRRRTHREDWPYVLLYAAACIVAKPAECLGQARYWIRRILRREPRIIEHKAPIG